MIKTAWMARASAGSTFLSPAFESVMAHAADSAAASEKIIHMVLFHSRLQSLGHYNNSASLSFFGSMYYLVYLSAARELFSDEELEEILLLSRKNNSKNNITGVLLYHDGAILQVLEGEREKVEELYLRLLRDARHCQVVQVMEGETSQRYFSDWSMCYRKLNFEQWNQLEGYLKPSFMQKNETKPTEMFHAASVFITSFVRTNF